MAMDGSIVTAIAGSAWRSFKTADPLRGPILSAGGTTGVAKKKEFATSSEALRNHH